VNETELKYLKWKRNYHNFENKIILNNFNSIVLLFGVAMVLKKMEKIKKIKYGRYLFFGFFLLYSFPLFYIVFNY
jgi:hypothetical protein